MSKEKYFIKSKGLDEFFENCVRVGALPDPNSKDPIAIVSDEKWGEKKKSLENDKYFAKEYDEREESTLVRNCREFV
ncbi:MAG: hypothetical protein NC489_40140, partial [Ruminococcus flavefaciens]|nr:hypothetical protein [Ruminococcus flavefaciens]